jgi:hypothetical protein
VTVIDFRSCNYGKFSAAGGDLPQQRGRTHVVGRRDEEPALRFLHGTMHLAISRLGNAVQQLGDRLQICRVIACL